MSNHIAQPTQDMKVGSSETNTKPLRLKKKTSNVKEVEATVHHDGTITYTDEVGDEKTYVVDSMEDYHFMIGECQLLGKKGFEVSPRLFKTITQSKPTPYLIVGGNNPVFIYPAGQMDRTQRLEALDVEDLIELKAKKAKKEADAKKIEKEKFKSEIDL